MLIYPASTLAQCLSFDRLDTMIGCIGLLSVAAVIGVQSATAPFIKPCKNADTECLMASGQYAVPIMAVGVPELGIKPLDPLHLDVVHGNEAGLKFTFSNTDVTGMKGCVIEAIKHDMTKSKQSLTIRCSVKLDGDYKLDGQILVLPVQGQGKYHIDIHDIIIKANTETVVVKGDDGKDHWHIKSWKHGYQTKTGARFTFQNLFNGNKVLAVPVEEFVNNNWGEVMKEIAPPIVYAIVEKVIEDVEALYKAVPAEELTVH